MYARSRPVMGNQLFDNFIASEALLQELSSSGILKDGEVAKFLMKKKAERLSEWIDFSKIKSNRDGRLYVHIGVKNARIVGKEMFIAKNEEDLINKLYDAFYGIENITLAQAYKLWQEYRLKIGTEPKTMLENQNDWKRFYAEASLTQKRVRDITVLDIKDHFFEITKKHQITYKRFVTVKGVLNGIFSRCVELEIIPHNIILDVDCSAIKKRCKPEIPKSDYTASERKAILEHLRGCDGIYEYAIRFAFNQFMRIGEIIPIKYSDIREGYLQIKRSTRRTRDVSLDAKGNLTFGKCGYETEARMKGNKDSGFREVPLNEEALKIVEELHSKYPENEFLFMRNGKQIYADTFNEHLKKVCKELGIEYRPSHQIRFTNAGALYEGGVPLSELSTMMGHANTATTLHYLRKRKPSEGTAEKVREILSAG